MSKKHYYLEQKHKRKVVRRIPTSLASEYNDRKKMEYFAPKEHKIRFVVSSTKEELIN